MIYLPKILLKRSVTCCVMGLGSSDKNRYGGKLCFTLRDAIAIRSLPPLRPLQFISGLGDLTRRDGEVIVETIFGSVIGALQSGDKIEIRGFGSFRIRQRKPRIGRNPKTGARVDVPAKKVPYFKPSKELRDLVNPGEAAKA